MKRPKSRFFGHHPRTYPTELSLCGAPGTFGVPFAQNDTANYMRKLQNDAGNYKGDFKCTRILKECS